MTMVASLVDHGGAQELGRSQGGGGTLCRVSFDDKLGSGPGRLGNSESGYVTQWGRDQGDMPGRGRDPFTRHGVKLYTARGPGPERQERPRSGPEPGHVTTV